MPIPDTLFTPTVVKQDGIVHKPEVLCVGRRVA
jgi:hypothetical protein